MAQLTFKSPNVKFLEKAEQIVTQQTLGITSLGLVGETTIGPAFSPILVSNNSEFRKYFGGMSTEKLGDKYKYLLPYYALPFLEEGNQLYVSRVLGKTGYDAGTGWAITVGGGLNKVTSGVTSINTGSSVSFTSNSLTLISGITITSVGPYSTGFILNKSGSTFTGTKIDLNVTYFDNVSKPFSGTYDYTATTISGTSLGEYDDMVVAIIRSRADYIGDDLNFKINDLILSDVSSTSGNPFNTLTLSASGPSLNEVVSFTLDPAKKSFIGNVLGSHPKDSKSNLYLESIYPDLLSKIGTDGSMYKVNGLVKLTGTSFTNYHSSYTSPETPWLVSELRSNSLFRLFKFVLFSDGDSANKLVKISIENIDVINNLFDVVVRDFNDTDDNPSVLEIFSRCNLNPNSNNFVLKRIGGSLSDDETTFLESSKSSYIYVVVNIDAPIDAVPCGFEGYNLRSFDSSQTGSSTAKPPKIIYKTSYSTTDKVGKTYLGLSEKGYTTAARKGLGINQNLFNFNGAVNVTTSYTKSNGFHLDSGATGSFTSATAFIGSFETGLGEIREAASVSTGVYSDINKRKFTVVPAGGFDGWDVHRTSRTTDDSYGQGGVNAFTNSDFNSYVEGFETFETIQNFPINLFATPGIDWYNNTLLVKEAIRIVEEVREDCLYIIDSPDVSTSGINEKSNVIAERLVSYKDAAELNTSFGCTFAPYGRKRDTDNNVNVWIPPTGEILKAIAKSDKTNNAWTSFGGLKRGKLSNLQDVKTVFKDGDCDTLYQNDINPLRKFSVDGVVIWGNKTLESIGVGVDTPLSRIDVRRLVLFAKQRTYIKAITLNFDPNDQNTIDSVIRETNKELQLIKNDRGLVSYTVSFDSTLTTPEALARNEAYFKVELTPTGTLESIGFTFSVKQR